MNQVKIPPNAERARARAEQLRESLRVDLDALKQMNARGTLSTSDEAAYERIEHRCDQDQAELEQITSAYPSLLPAVKGRDARNIALGTGITASQSSMTEWAAERRDSGDFTVEHAEEFSLGKVVRGMITGDWRDSDLERRALAGGVDSTGGFLLPTLLSGQVIDRLRPQIAVTAAGAPVVAVENHVLRIPRIATGITAGWKAEGDTVADSGPAFDAVELKPKTLAVQVKLSRELFEDLSSLAMNAIENEILKQLAVQIDAAALLGTGTSNQPTGLLNTTGVTQVTNGTNGTVANWAQVTDSVKRLRTANVEPTAVIWNPRTSATLGALTDTLGQPLRQPPYIDGIRQIDTNSVPVNVTTGSNTDTSYSFTGDWKQLYVGSRLSNGIGIRMLNDQSRYVDALSVAVVAYARLDFGVAHNEAFVIQKGVR